MAGAMITIRPNVNRTSTSTHGGYDNEDVSHASAITHYTTSVCAQRPFVSRYRVHNLLSTYGAHKRPQKYYSALAMWWSQRPIRRCSGVTRVGVTRGGNWPCHSYFFPEKNWRPFLVIIVCKVMTILAVRPRFSAVLSKFSHIFLYFIRMSRPLEGVTRGGLSPL